MPPRVRVRRRSNNEIARQLFQRRLVIRSETVFWTPYFDSGR
jgi:hypothetical protein